MDEPIGEEVKRRRNPREGASIFSSLTFLYTFKTFLRGYKRGITEDDLYDNLLEYKSSALGGRAVRMWEKGLENRKNTSLIKIIIKTCGWNYILIGAALALEIFIIQPSKALLLGELIRYYSEKERTGTPYVYSISLIAASLLTCILTQPYYMASSTWGLKIRVVCSCLIYNKIFRLNASAFNRITPGHIINLLSTDVNSFEKLGYSLNYIWITPLQVVLITYLIWREIGYSSLFAVGFISVFVLIYVHLRKILARYRSKISSRRDERIRLTNELIQGISVIKMYAWESAFSEIISRFRKLEINAIRKFSYCKGLFSFSQIFAAVAIFIAITFSVTLNETIDARATFVSITLFHSLCVSLVNFIPSSIAVIAEVKVALQRISTFLLCEEIDLYSNYREGNSAVIIRNGFAKWDTKRDNDSLFNLNIEIKTGSLTAVIGAVGSGKSSLCQVIQQELPLRTGVLTVNGSLSYASQEAWIFSGSIRQNILFGCEMDEVRYAKVVHSCALDTDFDQLPFGDKTIVGERGASLSGGQKARISLARCVYREADIYLLDDPMSAVDTRVGQHIFRNCIQTLLKGKTTILVTHQIQYLAYVDNIIALDNGAVVQYLGSEVQIKDFSKYLSHNVVADYEWEGTTEKLDGKAPAQEESKKSGSITFSTYKNYLLASNNYPLVIVTLIVPFLTEATTSGALYFIRHWLKIEQDRKLNKQPMERSIYIYVYCGIIAASVTLAVLRLILFTNLAMKSSQSLHNSMFANLLHASMKFFHSNPSGRILNRFTKDLLSMDELLPTISLITIVSILNVTGLLILICLVNSWFLIPIITLLATVYCLRRFYLVTSLDILRVESVARSPLYNYVQSTLQGLTTVRVFEVKDKLVKEFNGHLDTHTSALYMSYSVSRAFGYWIDVLAFLFITTTIIFYMYGNDLYGGNVGLVLSQALRLIGILQWGIRQLTEVENCMVSVERVLEYNEIETERNLDDSTNLKLPPTWPSVGSIQFRNVYLRYLKNGPAILKGLNFTVRPLEKIGIVGRTGAGKSSIISALFQLTETEGSIIIDGVDITTIGLHDLRRKISIIPQDPVLFSGTIRNNLDPFNEFDDQTLWKALEDVQLKKIVQNQVSGLDSLVSHDGSNFSIGQRQLVCLARALVKENKILIMDEATANVDLETDKIIQQTIRTKFKNCTILTVAHRINTIVDSDKILVLDDGELMEFDDPVTLLQNSDGLFFKMVQHMNKSVTTNTNTEDRNLSPITG